MVDTMEGATKAERARAALLGAELRVGVRSRGEVVTPLGPPEPAPLASLLPDGALPAGSVVSVLGPGPLQGSASLTSWLLGATQHDRHVALVGWPELGLVALSEAGVDLGRLYAVPNDFGQGAALMAALVDGFEIVVAGPHVQLTPSERRRLLTRTRRLDTAVLSALPWEGAAATLVVQRSRWSGPDHGHRWIRDAHLSVVRHSPPDGAGRHFDVVWNGSAPPTVTTTHAAAAQLTG
jgi:hypothetical protein